MASDPQEILTRVFTWSAVLIGLLVVASIVLWAIKRRQQMGARLSAEAPPFSLHELRKLHAEGKLSDEEYERARQAIIGLTPGVGTGRQAKASDQAEDDADPDGGGVIDEAPPDGEDPGSDPHG